MLLRPIFGETILYGEQKVNTNDMKVGGEDNSITPTDTPYMAWPVWQTDYSAPGVSVPTRGTFVHEIMHVWQYFHGVDKATQLLSNWWNFDDYVKSYDYRLNASDSIKSYNMEAQASIVEDYYRITKGADPLHNTGTDKSISTYERKMVQVRSAGLGSPPLEPNPVDLIGLFIRPFL